MQNVDTILKPKWVIPVEPDGEVYENYAVVIDQGRISDLLPAKDAAQRYHAKEIIELKNHALLPGFVNAHTHSPMILFRGLADDLPLMQWLNDYIWPAEQKWVDETFVAEGTRFAIAEMIKNGTTCFNEHYFFPHIAAQTAAEAGIRATIGILVMNVPTKWAGDEEEYFQKGFQAVKDFSDPLISFSFAPHAPYTTSDTILKTIKDTSEQFNMPIHMHVHETMDEVNESLAKFNKRPLQRLHDLGLLSPLLQCVHMTQIDQEDLQLLSLTHAHVTHCPESNLKLASGFCPVQTFLDYDINVALGTDSAVSNNNLDMIGEMRTAALLAKAVAKNATAVSATQALRMATLNGAKALNLDQEIGSIEIGKAADLVAIDLNHIMTQPTYHPISQIVYAASNGQISHVWVAGKSLLQDGKLMTLDEEGILANVKEWHKRIEGQK